MIVSPPVMCYSKFTNESVCERDEREIMRKIFKALLISLITLAVVACSGTPSDDTESKTLTVYSPHPSDTINLIVKEFQESTGITVEIVAAGTGELLSRVESEKDNPLADVFWGGGAESLASYVDYFESYEVANIDHIDAQYYDSENRWTGESPLPMVIMYNTNLVSEENAPTSWADVLKPEFKGQIAMADPTKSGSAYTILLTMMTAFGGDTASGWQFAKDFHANLDGKILSSSSNVYIGVADGEYALGLTLEKEAIKYVLAGSPVKIVYPSEGTSAVPDAVAVIKGAKNLDNAKLFLDFVSSKETQEIMASELSRRPVRDDVEAPEGLDPLADIKLVDYDFDWAANHKQEILDQWKEIVVGQ